MIRTKRDKQGVLVIAAVVLVIMALLGYRARIASRPTAGPDNCVGKPEASTVIVVDRSEESTLQTLNEIRARAMAYVRDSVKEGERVSVFAVDDLAKRRLSPLVSVCRPRQFGNRLVENVKTLEKRFHEGFETPLESALAPLQASSRESPLAQALTDISLSHYLSSDRNTLIIFSDMLENTAAFSLYHCKSPTDVIESFRTSRTGALERPKFRNTMVKLNMIPRLHQSRTTLQCRDTLWTWFFGDNPGPQAGLDPVYLPGGPSSDPERTRQ